jgi:hypothetical protein
LLNKHPEKVELRACQQWNRHQACLDLHLSSARQAYARDPAGPWSKSGTGLSKWTQHTSCTSSCGSLCMSDRLSSHPIGSGHPLCAGCASLQHDGSGRDPGLGSLSVGRPTNDVLAMRYSRLDPRKQRSCSERC